MSNHINCNTDLPGALFTVVKILARSTVAPSESRTGANTPNTDAEAARAPRCMTFLRELFLQHEY